MENIQCIFCSISSGQTVIEENGYTGKKCPSCGLIYVSPRPTLTETLNLYGHDQANISAESHILGAFYNRLHARHNLRKIRRFIRRGSMLEIGAGAGYFLDEARREGFEVSGIELNGIQAEFIRSKLGIPCEESPLDVSLFDGKRFDVIYHCDVISHFYNPISEFQKIHDKLGKNGMVVFETGNLGDVREEYYRFVTKFQYPDHLFFFGENNLKELLGRTGFEFIKVYRYSILQQLVIDNKLRKVKDLMKSKGTNKKIDERSRIAFPNIFDSTVSEFSHYQLSRNTSNYFTYLMRYKIGFLMPKKGRPQTVIVFARKKS